MNSTNAINLLQLMSVDLQAQKDIYQPTAFWSQASKAISNELIEQGFDNFRSLPTVRGFFAAGYGPPYNHLSSELIDQIINHTASNIRQKEKLTHILNGEMWALSDYRVLLAGNRTNNKPDLTVVSESKVGAPAEHFQFDKKWFSRSFLNYLLGLTFLKQHVDLATIHKVIEVGGGFGTLGEILSQLDQYAYVDIDIPPTAAASSYYLSQQPNISLTPYTETRDMEIIPFPDRGSQLVLCPWQLPRLRGDVDLFVNFISFQEMEPDVVEHYLNQVDRLNCNFILLRNLREGKQQKTENRPGVENPTLAGDYDRFLPNYQLVDTNVTPFGFRTLDGFNSELRLYRRK